MLLKDFEIRLSQIIWIYPKCDPEVEKDLKQKIGGGETMDHEEDMVVTWSLTKECQQPLEAGRVKEWIFPQKRASGGDTVLLRP